MADAQTSKPLTLEKALGLIFQEIRESKGLKQVDVSVGTGYVLRTVGIVERGEKSPTLRTMENFATFYEIPLEKIIVRAKRLRKASMRGPSL
jgi:transcriptional regulator with XRE-family HTH domain